MHANANAFTRRDLPELDDYGLIKLVHDSNSTRSMISPVWRCTYSSVMSKAKLFFALVLFTSLLVVRGQTTAFTYQGRLLSLVK
jgi:hypothetical protein